MCNQLVNLLHQNYYHYLCHLMILMFLSDNLSMVLAKTNKSLTMFCIMVTELCFTDLMMLLKLMD